jgi:hypothetical protein
VLRIDSNGDLWIPTKTLKTFKNGEVKDLIFKDDVTGKTKSIGIIVEVKKIDGLTYHQAKSTDEPGLKIKQYTTL